MALGGDLIILFFSTLCQIIVYGQTDGKAIAYAFDDVTGGLVVSHKYILPKKDYPGEGAAYGSIKALAWTPDGCALATLWSTGKRIFCFSD